MSDKEAQNWGTESRLMRFVGKKVKLNEEGVCEFAIAFSKTIQGVEWGLEISQKRREAHKQERG